MSAELTLLQSPAAVQAALDEFHRLGRTAFLARYGFGKSRDYLVRNPVTGELCDSKAIVGAAFGHQYPKQGPLNPDEFSGGEATVVPKLQGLGFEVVRIGEDWSPEEVHATVASYFEMLALEARQAKYNKTTSAVVHEVPGRIQRAHVDCVLEHMLHRFAHALRRLQIAALLDAVQAPDHLGRHDGFHGQRTDPREDVQLQVAHHLLGVAGRPFAVLLRLGMPGAGRPFKGV
jgi:hypothetical protein